MAYAELIEKAKDLSDAQIAELIDYADFLAYKNKSKANKVTLNLLKGEPFFMAEDFDETPDCFKEYM